MATKGDKFQSKDVERLRKLITKGRSGPRAQSEFHSAMAEIRKGPSYRRKWRKWMKAQEAQEAEASGQA